MKNKRKLGFRIWVLFSVALFLLIPLLSSPVAAFTQNLGSATTNNTPAGPTASGTISAPATISDNSPFNARFQVDYSYTDSLPGGAGSNHWIQIIGSYQPNGSVNWWPFSFTQNPSIFISQNGGTVTGTYTTGWITGYGGKGTNFQLYVYVNCQDVATTQTQTWTSSLITFTII
jgi:hypothetical protein